MPPSSMHKHIGNVLIHGKTGRANWMQGIKIQEPISITTQRNSWRNPIGEDVKHNVYDKDNLNGWSHSHTILTLLLF